MNINVIQGIVSFLIWSTFSTWFYVNYIKEFDISPARELAVVPAKEEADTADAMADKDKPTAIVAAPAAIQLSKSFTFHINTADLIHPGAIRKFTDSLQAALTDRTVSVSITGYTCDLGEAAYNFKLGQSRANYVVNALNKSSISWPQLIANSKGESSPLVPNTSEMNRIKNRRVTILITSKP